MSRIPRAQSVTGIYHVMLRGNNQSPIFNCIMDCRTFMKYLKECQEAFGFLIHAFCLMPNHVHLLIEVGNVPLSHILHDLETRYVKYYNTKYDRIGHLFQDRFRSKPVEDDGYYIRVLHYITQNPVKAGLCKSADAYHWSSLYLNDKYIHLIAFEEIRKNTGLTDEELRAFLLTPYEKEPGANPPPLPYRITDEEVLRLLSSRAGLSDPDDFFSAQISQQHDIVSKLLEGHCSMRQISRLFGLSRRQIKKFSE